MTARLAVAPAVTKARRSFVAFDLTRAPLFDPATGRALCHGQLDRMRSRMRCIEKLLFLLHAGSLHPREWDSSHFFCLRTRAESGIGLYL